MIAGDAETRDLYVLAFQLRLTMRELLALPVEELRGWVAFLEWRARQDRKG